MDNLINSIFPPKCIFCKKIGPTLICPKCLSECGFLSNQYCVVCDKKSSFGATHTKCMNHLAPVQSISVFDYDDKVRRIIKTSKYGSKEFMALKELTKTAVMRLTKYAEIFKEHLILPIPVSKAKYTSRGFNQAEIIALLFGKHFRLGVYSDILKRTKETSPQYNYTRKERFKNVENIFDIVESKRTLITGKKVLLVDDICTTGATLLEASKTLMGYGAFEVRCFTLSKKVIKPD